VQKKRMIILFLLGILTINNYAFASEYDSESNHIEIRGTAAILMERSTGRVIFEYNPDLVLYPASMTKTLTALVALDYMAENDIVVVGTEINYVPPGSSRAGHILGEHITGLNLIRGLMMPSGNDTANIVAAHVARQHTGNDELSFTEAEEIFTNLMNERAREIGAVNSNFANAHGFHDPNLYTTVRELAMIANVAMEHEAIRKVSAEAVFVGNSGGGLVDSNALTREINWFTHNRLLAGPFHNADVTGLKTGFTDQAGFCLIGSAERNGIEFISVVTGFTVADHRWPDTSALFNYGFDNYSLRIVQHSAIALDEIEIYDPKWGHNTSVQVFGDEDYVHFLTVEERNSIVRTITYDPEKLMIEESEEGTKEVLGLIAPLSAGQIIGRVEYTLNGDILFSGNIIIDEYIYERTFFTDATYIFDYLRDNAISIYGFSAALLLISFGMAMHKVITILRRRKKRNRRRYARKYNL